LNAIAEKLLPDLLPFIVQSEGFFEHALNTSAGSLSPRTKWKDLAKYQFPLPPIPEQRRIAEILWAADGMVESWNVSLHHFYLVEKKLVKEFLYKNGSDLQEYKLGDIISLDYGKGLPQTDRDSGPYAVVGSNGIIDRHSVYQYESPGIVLGRKGAAGNVNWIDEPYWPIDTAYNVRIVENNINFRFLYYLLSTMDLPRFQISTAIPGINREDIYSLKVKIPNIDTQRKIVTILENIEESKNLIISHIEASKQFSKLLLKELLHYV
jgi:type I restriction enzyme S subunit